MSVEEELKKDHSDMQAVVDSKQKIIDAQVSLLFHNTLTEEISRAHSAGCIWFRRYFLPVCFAFVCAVTCVLRLRKQRVTEIQRDV